MGLTTKQTLWVCAGLVTATLLVAHQGSAFIAPYGDTYVPAQPPPRAATPPAAEDTRRREDAATASSRARGTTPSSLPSEQQRPPPPPPLPLQQQQRLQPETRPRRSQTAGTAAPGRQHGNALRHEAAAAAPPPPFLRGNDLASDYLGCFSVTPTERVLDVEAMKSADALLSPRACAESCAAEGYSFFEMAAPQQCWCGERGYPEDRRVPDASCKKACPGDASMSCGGPGVASVHRLTQALPPPLTFFIEPAKNRNSFFLTGRVKRWASGRYTYRLAVLNHKLTSNTDNFRREMCVRTPGMKVRFCEKGRTGQGVGVAARAAGRGRVSGAWPH